MAKFNPTVFHFVEKKPDSTRVVPEMSPVLPPGKFHLTPHCWTEPRPSRECSYDDELLKSFSTMPRNFRLFMDTGFITSHELPEHLWDHIVTKHIAITEGVWDELQPWVNRPDCNEHFRDYLVRCMKSEASGKGHSHVSLVSETDLTSEFAPVADYYIRLLGMRKYFGLNQFQHFLDRNGREPTPTEIQSICQEMSGARGWRLAKKAIQERHKPLKYVDEALVVNAVFHSILFDIPTVVLTRDNDVFEQFYKAIYLVGTHYISMLMATRFHENPAAFKTVAMPKAPGMCAGDENLFVDMVEGAVLDLKDRTLPPVQCTCVLLSTSDKPLMVSDRSYGLVQDMVRVLRVRSKTRGRNTDLFGVKNFHVSFDPRKVVFGINGPALVHDEILVGTDADKIPLTRNDTELAIFTDEQFATEVFTIGSDT